MVSNPGTPSIVGCGLRPFVFLLPLPLPPPVPVPSADRPLLSTVHFFVAIQKKPVLAMPSMLLRSGTLPRLE